VVSFKEEVIESLLLGLVLLFQLLHDSLGILILRESLRLGFSDLLLDLRFDCSLDSSHLLLEVFALLLTVLNVVLKEADLLRVSD
jgi:hypothetical protein